MSLFQRRCSVAQCPNDAERTRCQNCGKPFCSAHVEARTFYGYRDAAGRGVARTRFVCSACATRSRHAYASADTAAFHDNATAGPSQSPTRHA